MDFIVYRETISSDLIICTWYDPQRFERLGFHCDQGQPVERVGPYCRTLVGSYSKPIKHTITQKEVNETNTP